MGLSGEEMAEAWANWLRSDTGKSCNDIGTFVAPPEQAVYLQNRLWHAFMAGAEAAEARYAKSSPIANSERG